MMRARRCLLIFGIAVFVLVTAWWIVHVPYRPDRLFRAIPARATFVSRHVQLQERWDRLYENPLVMSLFIGAGVKPAAMKAWADDPQMRAWFDRLAGRDVVVAYVPPRVSHGDPTWVVASWLGGESQRLRWQMAWQRSKEFESRPSHHGHRYWRVMSRDIEPGTVLMVALVEGMLIGCLSDREDAIIELLDTYDGLRPSVAVHSTQPAFIPLGVTTGVLDAVWMEMDAVVERRGASKYPLGIAFREISRTSLTCRAYLPDVPAPRTMRPGRVDELTRIFGDAPVWIMSVPLAWLVHEERENARAAWRSALLDVARAQKAETAVIALLSKSYAGRIVGISVPAVIIALPLAHPEQVPQHVERALDTINAHSRWGLIPYPWAQGTNARIVVIEGTGQNMYARLAPDEKPAYAVNGSWLLFAAQASALKLLLERSGGGTHPCWWGAVKETAPFWLWGDFRMGSEMIRLALSAYAFALVMQDASGSQRKRQQLNEWKAWLDAFEPLEQCAVSMEPWNSNGLAVDVVMRRVCP